MFPVIDERYDDDPDARFDVYRPGSAVRAGRRLPTVVGPTAVGRGRSKDEIGDYLRMIAAAGITRSRR